MQSLAATKTFTIGFKLNKNLKLLIFVNTILNFIVGMFAPFYAVFVEKIGGGVALAGTSWALFSVISGILILVFSKWELHVKRQFILLSFGYIIKAIVFLSYAFMKNIPQLLITQVLWGISSAVGTPAFDALYTSSTSKETSIVEWADWEGVSAIATGLAALVGGILIQTIGFKILFLIMSLSSALLGCWLLYQKHKIQKSS